MPSVIGIDEARRLLDEDAQLVDVLPEGEYAERHLPGAKNIPLKKMTAKAVEALDKQKAVIVYCHDFQ